MLALWVSTSSHKKQSLILKYKTLLDNFVEERDQKKKELSTDQLLNAIYLLIQGIDLTEESILRDVLLRSLAED